MKGCSTIFACVLVMGWPAAASAQLQPQAPSPLVRADAVGIVGWLNARADDAGIHDDWYSRSVYGGAGVGWYWNDHLKSEIEFGASSGADLYRSEQVLVGGYPVYRFSEIEYRTARLSLGQQYQFLRNAWFHPHLGAGLDLVWTTRTEEVQPSFRFEPALRDGRQIEPARRVGPDTTLDVRPFAGAGFKAYVSTRAFVRTDVRVLFAGDGPEQVLVRCGVGVDF